MRETPNSIILTLCRHCGEEVEIFWSEIERIIAFKQDLFNPQIVVLEIHAERAVWEVDAADCSGFETFTHLLCQRLTGMQPFAQWWTRVTDPLGRQESHELYVRSSDHCLAGG